MSDRIAVFNRGRIEQVGSPAELYERPATRFVAGFIGQTNLIEGSLAERCVGEAALLCARSTFGLTYLKKGSPMATAACGDGFATLLI
jgi:ABC-type Fe3+/spermidine/putrescine transport system ATPase subunit